MTRRRDGWVVGILVAVACTALYYFAVMRPAQLAQSVRAPATAVAVAPPPGVPAQPPPPEAAHADVAPATPAATTRAGPPAAPKPPVVVHLRADDSLAEGDRKTLIPKLKSAAEHGDADAAFALYSILKDCANLLDLTKQRNAMENSKQVDEDQIAQMDSQIAIGGERCAGVHSADIDTRLKWLETAAAGGNETARVDYGKDTITTLIDQKPSYVIKNPDDMTRIRDNALQYLADASANGNATAMYRLAIAYTNEGWGPTDPTLAYAYMLAASNTGLMPSTALLVERWATSLTPEQRAYAATLAARMPGG